MGGSVRWTDEVKTQARERVYRESLDAMNRQATRGATIRTVTPKRPMPAPRWSPADRAKPRPPKPPKVCHLPAWKPPGFEEFQENHAGSPLGVGMPSGSPLRKDGESHSDAWRRLLREDPCAYCDKRVSSTVDHIEPRSLGREYRERWANLTGACAVCNQQKAAHNMLLWMLGRAKQADARERRAARRRTA